MADAVSSSNRQPSAKRRRLNPAAIVPVPVYSGRVSSSLQLKPTACLLGRKSLDDDGDKSLWAEFNPRRPASTTRMVELSDSEEEPEPGRFRSKPAGNQLGYAGCPSPPPPESPVQKQSSKARRKIREINKKLRAVSTVLSPEPLDRRTGRRRNRRNQRSDPNDDSDVLIMSPADGSDSPREIPLKIRCRTDVHKVLVLPSTRLSEVLGRLAAILEVPPPRLLLLRDELELPAGATVAQLGLGIADILECVVMSSEEQSCSDGGGCSSGGCVSVKLQSRDRSSSQLFFVHREAPLGSVFSQYLSRLPAGARGSVRFHFDGSKVAGSQTAAQLELEDGDIIEVWT
ncbi:NFATC2-interacting protein isoform X2 [Poeciliopsis prolifica]|uniref:NFATC2-interacting protein isoform X2 n=1 Tax=Poeciliopsis prolifica TaxID=188132 RepID=UPI002413B59F|nr:NFATC2-interacting protein isoform X2 [Poeciliopsis prolifica]